MAQQVEVSAEAQESYGRYFETTEALEIRVMDFSSHHDRRFILTEFARSGITPENNAEFAAFVDRITQLHEISGPLDPGHVALVETDDGLRVHPLFADLADPKVSTQHRGQAAPQGPGNALTIGPIQTITSFQQSDPTARQYSASGLVSIPNQPQSCWQQLGLFDEQGNPQGTPDSIQQTLACENVQLFTQAAIDPSDQWARAVLSSNWIDQNGNPHSVTVRAEGSVIPTNITSTNPNDLNGDGMIKFCFGRHAADCDYDPGGASRTNVFLPIDGSTTFDSPIKDPVSSGASVMISITHPEPQTGGGCYIQGDTTNWFQTYVTLTNNDMTMNWNDPTVHFTQIDPCMPNGSIVYYNMVTNLTLTINNTDFPTYFGISTSPQTPVSNGHWLQLAESRIYWSCLAEDSVITLADGSEVPIASLVEGDRVLSDADGTERTISATFVGMENAPLVQIVTENGESLRLTETHPVPTDEGVRLARNLAVGDSVFTTDGPSPLISVDRVAYTGNVRNLSVVNADGQDPVDPTERTFFANGIQVGDNEMQWYFDRPGSMVASAHQPLVPVMSARGRALLEADLGQQIAAQLPNVAVSQH